MIIGRIIGWLFCAVGIAALGWDIATFVRTGEWTMVTAGQVWFAVDPASLNVAQAGIQRYVLPELWDPVIVTILLMPLALVGLFVGLLLILICLRRS